MIFWRKKNNISDQEKEEQDDKLLHPDKEPALEPSTDYEAALDADALAELVDTEADILDELEEVPVPEHRLFDDRKEAEDLSDHTEEGGWFWRLTRGLSKSSTKLTSGISDLLTKKKLDQETLDQLEELLIEADLGPKTAAKIIADFSKDRFGKDISEEEVREALASGIEKILKPVAKPINTAKPDDGPFVILVCGVNGAGKTTTIGKYANHLQREQKKSVLIAAGDTFRAAAIEQLGTWAKRSGATMFAKDVGADAAAVAFEAYDMAISQKTDILMIDTAGRLQNKSNLMAELEKIIRVLKKRDEAVPHAVLLVLDATTGQNAFSQVETFKKMVDVTGLIVTKLDGSAKGGVLVGLADQFGLPVHAIGVGEGLRDLRPFEARQYARSLMGLEA
ncbi:MAG: signal recognition particle-docking protein FtsY [Alphaproteobacteria bacterium]|nr:signal recognition particle-docking protein FtsY [Alphaproteobacteria bacterium]MBP7759474.1 signal recognition particle-docking protein FtsY [Alphaproteobacteria bacterium]MBP7762814.1 signal recognition particle-docking protein FtsY [Alphaproteobacteria bacterium]MBP7904334.1 signal recognition particle-docking protein FtsY [Alphaproteobacteria bacterium]